MYIKKIRTISEDGAESSIEMECFIFLIPESLDRNSSAFQ